MKYPDMRNELIDHLGELSNLSYQRACWVNKKCPEDIKHDEFNYVVHFLFDDTTLSSEAEKWIGLCLRNDKEAESIKLICTEIDNIFKKYGHELTDAEYIELPEWQVVVDAAIYSLEYFK